MELNAITEAIIGAAIEVHKQLGVGLLRVLIRTMHVQRAGVARNSVRVSEATADSIQGIELDCGYRIDLLVAGSVVVEIKSVEKLLPIHEAQLLTYLRLGGWHVGLLINFNVEALRLGIKRVVNELPE